MMTKQTRQAHFTRRAVLKAGVASAVWIGAAPSIIGSASAAEDNIVYVNTWGGTWTAAQRIAYFEPFTAKTGIQVKTAEPVSFAKLKAQVQSNSYDWDITGLGAAEFLQALGEGLLEPLDYTALNKANIPPQCIYKDAGVNSVVIGTNIVYRKDKFPNGGPQSWADFWDVKKFPGNRSLFNQPETALPFALLADGVSKDKLYPLDLDRAFKSLDKIKPHIKVWWTQGNQSEQLIRDGEVDMIGMWNARAQVQMNQGVPLQMVWNEAQNSCGYWCVPKGTPRKKAAFKFMEFVIQPVGEAKFCEQLFYGPSNPASLQYLPKDVLALSPSTPEHEKAAFRLDAEWFGPRSAQIKERWAQWMAS